jgi:glycosyltransferase involved in cell wall biosynthesis
MLISVIITCHNLDKYIGDAINSVLSQVLIAHQIEIIVIDDYSSDSSSDIIKSFKAVRYIRTEKNIGVLMATILGIENSSGEILFFLDGDDIWDLNKLSIVVDRFQKDSLLAFVSHDLSFIDGNGNLLSDKISKSEKILNQISTFDENIMIRDGVLFHKDYVWLGSALSVHRTLGKLQDFCVFAKSLTDPFNTYQDWPLAFWVACQKNVNFGYEPRKLFQYRIHGFNYSGDSRSIEKALRNFKRSYNTLQAISEIGSLSKVSPIVQKVTLQKCNFYLYLFELYSGHRLNATKLFICSIPYLIENKSLIFKEILRFCGIQCLGANFFIRLLKIKILFL